MDQNIPFPTPTDNVVPAPQVPIPSPTPSPTITELPGVFTLLGQTWAIYKERMWTFVGIGILPALIITALLAAFAGGGFLFLLKYRLTSLDFTPSVIAPIILSIIVLVIITIIIKLCEQAALMYAIKDNQEQIGIIEAYKRGLPKIGSLFWISFLTGIILLIGFILLIIPGIIFAVWFAFAGFILISEDIKGMDALKKSKEYVKGRFGSVLWHIFFISALFLIILIALGFTFGIIISLLKIPFGAEIIEIILGSFLGPLLATYFFVLYQNLKSSSIRR